MLRKPLTIKVPVGVCQDAMVAIIIMCRVTRAKRRWKNSGISAPEMWSCSACTYLNLNQMGLACVVCGSERVDEESTPSVECTQGHQKVDLPQVSTWSGAESFFSEMGSGGCRCSAGLQWSTGERFRCARDHLPANL